MSPSVASSVVASLSIILTLSGALAQTSPPPLPQHALGDPVQLSPAEIEAQTQPAPAQTAPSSTPAPAPLGVAPGVPVSGFSWDNDIRNCVVAGYHEYYLESEGYESVMNWTGDASNCTAGTVSSEYLDKTLRRINYYRAQTGVLADIYLDATKNAKCQEAALMMAANNALSHFPPNTWTCWTQDGSDAAGASNLSLGSNGPESVDRQILDTGLSNTAAGHRRWLLYSRAQEMGVGSVPINGSFPYTYPEHPDTTSIWVIGNFKSPPPAQAVTWPNEGFCPYQLVPNDLNSLHSGTPYPRWSYSYPGANFSSATVTMTQGATPVPVVLETVGTGFADNTIVWKPSGIPGTAPSSDTTYTVTINGIASAPFTSAAYNVTIIDPYTLNDPAVITGPANPVVGINNTYTFTAVNKAEEYELCIAAAIPGTWLEGAEISPAPQVIDNTDASYNLLSSAYSNTGSRSFHLATPGFGAGDSFAVDRTIIPQAGSQIHFDYRRFFMHPDTKLRVEISTDSGSSFDVIHSIDGQNSLGNSSQDDPAFIPASVAVPAAYIGASIQVRFRLEPTGSTYVDSSDTNGLHIDDVEVTNSLELTSPTMQTLASTATSFDFNPSMAGLDYYLQIRPTLGGHQFGYGPALVVTSVAPPSPPVITSAATAEGVQGAAFSHTVTATNSPASYGATGLPAGASIDTATGEITGQIVPGTYPGITVSATNAGGTGNAALTITVLTGYEKYVQDNYPALGAPTDDHEKDGLANMMEAAILGMNPTASDPNLFPQLSVSGGNLHWTFPKSGVAGLDYQVEGTSDLTAGSWTTSGITVVLDNATTLEVTYPLTGSSQFWLRLVVTQNNDPTL